MSGACERRRGQVVMCLAVSMHLRTSQRANHEDSQLIDRAFNGAFYRNSRAFYAFRSRSTQAEPSQPKHLRNYQLVDCANLC